MYKLYYVSTTRGCTIKKGKDEDSVYNAVQREIGTMEDVSEVREATEADIAWVRGMGGYVPELAKKV